MKMCPAISTCHSDLILHSRVSKEPIIVAYTAFSKRQVSSFMSFYSSYAYPTIVHSQDRQDPEHGFGPKKELKL